MRYGGQDGQYGGYGPFISALVAANPTFTGTVTQTGASIVGGSYTGQSGLSLTLGSGGMAFISAPTGSMANNGAVTLGTALDSTYSEGCYLYLPASAISAGSAAGWYWTVMSSTTVGTVYNSTYTTGIPTVGTATAFATTGPGAFTGVTSEVGITIPVSAGLMGLYGAVSAEAQFSHNNSAGNKIHRIRFGGSGGTVYVGPTSTTTTGIWGEVVAVNSGAAAVQKGSGRYINSGSAWAITTQPLGSTVDTSLATSVFLSTDKAVATDYGIVRWFRVRLEKSA